MNEIRGRSGSKRLRSKASERPTGWDRPRAARGRRLRGSLTLARIEAWLLIRSLLVLVGLLVGAGVVWTETQNVRPEWWDAAWRLGYGQMVLSVTVLVAAQLAAGRVWRDHLQDLYDSFPTPAGTRTSAQLLAAIGALPASLLLLAAAAGTFELRGAVGTPSPAVLVGGLLLVVAGAVIGVAVGARFPHPLAGVLAALVWFGTFSQTNRFNSAVAWLFPWTYAGVLRQLPAPLPGYPPAAAHDVELAGIAALAAAVALVVAAKSPLARAGFAVAAGVAVVVACVAGAVQLRPVPTSALDHLVEEVATPALVQQCTTTDGVHYCVYQGSASLVSALRGPVSGVLSYVPARPAQPLTVRQVVNVTFDSSITYGHSKQQVNSWLAQLRTAPVGAAAGDAIYPIVGTWPTGSAQGAARFDLALGAAEWAVGLPPTTGNEHALISPQCVPVDQAREAVAIWLAILASHPSISSLQAGLPVGGGAGAYTLAGHSLVATWTYPGEYAEYLASPGAQTTADGYLLAHAMTSLPVQRVQQVLDQGWTRWLDPHTSDAALAAALGVNAPTFPVPPLVAANPPSGPGQPVCAS